MNESTVPDGGRDTLYIVTGAGGHLGGTVMRALRQSGCEARGLLTTGSVPAVTGPGLRYYSGDVCDERSLHPVFQNSAGRDLVVIHTAAMISIAAKMPPRLYDVNVGGVKNVLGLCRRYGVKRLVHVSSVHAIPELPGGQTMTEPSDFSPDLVEGGYAKTKAEAAQAVLDAAAEGLDAVIVFPSGIIGPYDSGRNHLVQMAVKCMQGKLPACVGGGYDFVDVRDVAAGCLLAAKSGRKGEGYILSGHYSDIPGLISRVCGCCGRKNVPVIPSWLAQAAVPAIDASARFLRQRPLYTAYSLRTLRCNSRFSSAKARDELGSKARSLEDTVSDMVAWLEHRELPLKIW